VAGGEYSAKYNAQQAATSATNAASSASASASSATASASSATSAASAQAAAETARDQTFAAFDSFDDRYLGAKSSDPTVDNDGNPLVAGALYFNTVSSAMKVYTGSVWVDAYAAGTMFVQKAGSTMTGPLVLYGDAIANLEPAPLQQLNAGLATKAALVHTHTASQISDSTTAGRDLLTAVDAAAQRTSLGLGSAALLNTSGVVQQDAVTGSAYLPAGSTAQRPGTPAAGYIRYNTTTGKFEGYGSSWGNIGGGAAIGDTPPANPGAGDLWWESDNGVLYVYYTDTNSSQWVAIVSGGAPVDQTPAGTIIHTARTTPPTGYLKADGSLVSRTTYATLFTAIGTTFGSGDGATTFKLPDLRGEFVRGWDDGRGIDSGRTFGSAQTDELKAHTHTYVQSTYTYPSLGNPDGAGYTTIANPSGNTTVNTGSTGGTETRPRNVALLACIKF
jgi:microcystin-dependent protein